MQESELLRISATGHVFYILHYLISTPLQLAALLLVPASVYDSHRMFSPVTNPGPPGNGHYTIFQPEIALPATLKRQTSRVLQVAKGVLYVIGTLQLLTAFVAACVFFAKLKDGGAHYASIPASVLISNAFLGVCGGLGLVAASGRSRVVICLLLPASLLVTAMSCILINTLVSWCQFNNFGEYGFSRVYCGRIRYDYGILPCRRSQRLITMH